MRPYRGVLALAEGEMLRVCKLWPTQLLGPIINWSVFVLILGVTLSTRIGPMDGVDYRDFVVPGMCTMGVLNAATSAPATSLWQARHDGYINDVLSAPLRPVEILLGYLLGGSFRALVVGTGLLGVGRVLVGVPVKQPLVLLAAWLLALALFGALGLILGLVCRAPEQLQFALYVVVQTLAYLGGVYFSTSVLPEPYRDLIRLDPVFWVAQAVRAGLLGRADAPVWLSLTITAALAGAMLVLALWLLETGKGLKT